MEPANLAQTSQALVRVRRSVTLNQPAPPPVVHFCKQLSVFLRGEALCRDVAPLLIISIYIFLLLRCFGAAVLTGCCSSGLQGGGA